MGTDKPPRVRDDDLAAWTRQLQFSLIPISPEKRWEHIQAQVTTLPHELHAAALALMQIGADEAMKVRQPPNHTSFNVSSNGVTVSGMNSEHAAEILPQMAHIKTEGISATGGVAVDAAKIVESQSSPKQEPLEHVKAVEKIKARWQLIVGIALLITGAVIGIGTTIATKGCNANSSQKGSVTAPAVSAAP